MSAAFDPVPILARELGLTAAAVGAVCRLLGEGGTVPFIARYRKEATSGLDEVQIRTIEERRAYLVELEARRATVLASIAEQGKLTDDLKAKIERASDKAALEDLYLPYKPKRRTRAMIARERGLSPLADLILSQPATGDPVAAAAPLIDPAKEVPDAAAALAGARDIAAEQVAERADVRALVRRAFADEGALAVERTAAAGEGPSKFQDYFDYREPIGKIPSHRYLAIRRGEEEGALRSRVDVDAASLTERIGNLAGLDRGSPFAGELELAIKDGYKRLLAPSVETDVRIDLKLQSDRAAVDVFADNLKHLLLAAPLGGKPVIGVDPGLRTGCKCAAVDATGKFLETITVFPTQGDAARERAARDLGAFIARHRPAAIAVGNGTGGRETEAFAREVARAVESDAVVVAVSEAGASVYSASDVAREEFPDLDLTIRGAISIARRLQDPLAELVKVEPKAIGVGQYQHDVHQPLLGKKLGEVVESCVNHVGVALNTASAALLSYVAGITPATAKKIVEHRERAGAFKRREDLLAVAGVGPRTFQQAAGFLRLPDGEHPLDRSAVHPERYELCERIAGDLGATLAGLVGDPALADRIDLQRYVGAGVGEPTLRDIVAELKKPGRDPRAEFAPPRFRDDVRELTDLSPGMALEGVVTNVTAFGAFVDLGVHQDGLVHVSQLSDKFVKDPRDVVKVGDKLKVRVLEVDLPRKRISLTAKSGAPPAPRGPAPSGPRGDAGRRSPPPPGTAQFKNNPFAALGKKP